MSRCDFTDDAIIDLESIHDYIARDSPPAAARLVQLVRERCFLLSDNPMMGRSRADLAPNLRSLGGSNHIIFYRPVEDGVQILRIICRGRNVEGLFG